MQTPELGREPLADQYAAGSDISMEQIFAVEELLMEQQDKGIPGLNRQACSVPVTLRPPSLLLHSKCVNVFLKPHMFDHGTVLLIVELIKKWKQI